MSVSVGDLVQIKDGGIDVTNGLTATAGYLYGEGGPWWATVEAIVEDWNTGARWGLPQYVTKVRCSNQGVVVWQVRPEDIVEKKISQEPPEENPPEPEPVEDKPDTIQAAIDIANKLIQSIPRDIDINLGSSLAPYAPGSSDNWNVGWLSTRTNDLLYTTTIREFGEAKTSESFFVSDADLKTPSYKAITGGANSSITNSMEQYDYFKDMGYDDATASSIMKKYQETGWSPTVTQSTIYRARYRSSWNVSGRRTELRDMDKSKIQNGNGFPKYVGVSAGSTDTPAKYDYQILIDDPNLTKTPTLEDKLMRVRAQVGIPVHGNNRIAKSMKLYMYNRFKVPDWNLAHNKTFTHIFFTRPDLNLLVNGLKANSQTLNHTDSALIWRRHPELFKLLTDRKRCGDQNNFNMLLSNQISAFNMIDETLSTYKAGKSWNEHEMMYAKHYTGRSSGELTITFSETSDLLIINLIKLWMTYIDNVSRGAWVPNYKIGWSHVFDRAIDYAASMYVFKTGPDGEDILYWTKYYGIYPISSGASALNWEAGNNNAGNMQISINFAYQYKRDMNPISLLEFNDAANISDNVVWHPSYDANLNASSRPFVGTPYVEMDLGDPILDINGINKGKSTSIRLKYLRDEGSNHSDIVLFKNNMN